MAITLYKSPVGIIQLSQKGDKIVHISFKKSVMQDNKDNKEELTPLLTECKKQFDEYFFEGKRGFSLPLFANGTKFQKKVWKICSSIEYGKTISYKEIATELGSKSYCRAVGGALGKNPLPIVIPCHRVVASDGSLGGYSGGIEIKKYLLNLEKNKG